MVPDEIGYSTALVCERERVFQRLGGAGVGRFCPRGGHQNIEPGCVDLQGVDWQEDVCPPVALFIGFLLSPHIFFSSHENDHLIRTIHSRKTSRTSQDTSSGHPAPESSPQKKKRTPVHPLSKVVAPLLSHRGQIACFLRWLSSCLQVCGLSTEEQCLML